MVSSHLKFLVEDKVQQCCEVIEQHYGIVLPKLSIFYNINSSRLAGEANITKSQLRFNPVFLEHYTDHYIKTTVPHEVAHIAVRHIYDAKRPRGLISQPHGWEWAEVMLLLGVQPSRCHTYEVPPGVRVGKLKSKYIYSCSTCNKDVVCGPRVHRNIQAEGRVYYHKECGKHSKLIYKAPAGRVTRSEALQQGKTVA